MKLLILGGGHSPERDVSLRSAAAVTAAVRELGHTAIQLDPRDDHDRLAAALRDCDMVLPILHGAGGEDGTIQVLIEAAGKPYLGTRPEASRQCFDKFLYHQQLAAHQLPTPASQPVDRTDFPASDLARRPYVLKPVTGGSSVDTFIVRDPAQPPAHMLEAFDHYPTMLLEELVEGTEVTVGVLEDSALPVVEIIPPAGQEFDYDNKYNGTTQELCPPRHVSAADQQQAQKLALAAHRLMGCRHLSRTDIIITPQHQFYILETNTLPGLTAQSLFPQAAAAAGLSWQQLVERFIALAKAAQ
jgi:D-alanine-D-alanine ligase